MVSLCEKGGQRIGILMLNTRFERLPGDIGHPDTFDFPVERLVVEAANSENVVERPQGSLAAPFVAGAMELERRGVKGIATSCGFLFRFQSELARSVNIPVVSSSLLLLPLVRQMVGDRTIGILTAKASSLSRDLARLPGEMARECVIEGMEGTAFYRVYVGNSGEPSVSLFEEELLVGLDRLRERSADRLGAVILECTNMPPFASLLRRRVDAPVFDCCDLVRLLHASVLH